MNFHAHLFTEHREQISARVYEKQLEKNVLAVYIEGEAKDALDGECGAQIVFDLGEIEGLTALQRNTEFWCEPVFAGQTKEIPEETQMLVVKHADGTFTVLLPVVSKQYRCTLFGDEDGIHAKLFTWQNGICACNCLAFVYTRTDNPISAANDCFLQALKALDRPLLPRNKRVYPEIFEYLGWCSWDALEIRVNEEDLLKKCLEFEKKEIPVRWAILDDMWATVPRFNTEAYENRKEMFKLMHSSSLADFEAEPKRFPQGLKHTISKMKEHLSFVGIWHPTTGYWFGIDPESELYRRFKQHLVKLPDGRYIVKPTYEDYTAFLNGFHAFLKDCGADFVKIDNQSILRRFYKYHGSVGEMATAIHKAIDDSAEAYFEGNLINCMGCASENVWNRPRSPISRCSNDFQPENKNWFTHHILQCAYTCLFQGPVIYSDWDMWWTDDAQALKNSVIRSISGGPIYVSDQIGRSVKEIIMPLILRDGRILRCENPALPTLDCFAEDPRRSRKLFKLQNLAGNSGALAVFNLDEDERSAEGSISPADILGLEGDRFAVYEHIRGELFVMNQSEHRALCLENRDDFRLYTFTPIVDEFAVLGLKDKFMSPLAVKHVSGKEFTRYEDGICIVYDHGEFIEK